MFEVVGFVASSRKSIRLDTRQGNHVDNEQSLPPDQQAVTLFDRVVEQHTHWVMRKGMLRHIQLLRSRLGESKDMHIRGGSTEDIA